MPWHLRSSLLAPWSTGALAFLLTLLPGHFAEAGFPEDINVQNLKSGANPFANSDWQGVFNFVAREAAMAISPKALSPASTLGLYGFELGFEGTVSFLHDDEGTSSGNPDISYWRLLTSDDPDSLTTTNPDAVPVMVQPTIRLRKGLPYSFEVGTSFSYIAQTRQGVIGGYGRWALNEGWRRVPDISITLGYNAYIGNEQLDLGVLEFDLAVGYTFPFGIDDKYASARFSPFAGWGHATLHARPKNVSEEISDKVLPITGFAGSALGEVDELTGNPSGIIDPSEFQFDKFFVGFAIQSAHFSFLIDGEFIVPRGVHSVSTRMAIPF